LAPEKGECLTGPDCEKRSEALRLIFFLHHTYSFTRSSRLARAIGSQQFGSDRINWLSASPHPLYTLSEFKKRGIGWLVYLLHDSLVADAHQAEFGPLSAPGNLAFI
jgi:hypothetical protein